MVKIEFLASESVTTNLHIHLEDLSHQFPHEHVGPNNPCTIIALAKTCAVTQIQAIWRGFQCRKLKYKRKSNEPTITQQHEIKLNIESERAALIIQRVWKRHKNIKVVHSHVSNNFELDSKLKLKRTGTVNIATQTESHLLVGRKSSDETIRGHDLAMNDENNDEDQKDSKDKVKLDGTSSRREIINHAYNSCRSRTQMAIHLNGFEILNILQAMSVLAHREYQILSKTALASFNEASNRCIQGKYLYSVRLTGPLRNFEKDINTAWKSLIQKTSELSPSSTIFLRNKGNILKSNSSSIVARSHIQNLINLSDETLSILEHNENIILYDTEIIRTFLLSIGLDIQDEEELYTNKTILDYLESEGRKVESSFLRNRIQSALVVARLLIEWEEKELGICTNGLGRRKKFNKTTLEEKDQIIFQLRDELQQLKHIVQNIEKSPCACYQKQRVENHDSKSRKAMDNSLTQGKSTCQKRMMKQNYPNNSFSKGSIGSKIKHKRRQESVHRVDINFSDLFEKEKRKSIKSSISSQQKNASRKSTEQRQSLNLPMYNHNIPASKSKMSLAQTIAKAKQKRSQYFNSKTAWTRQPKRIQNLRSETQEELRPDNHKLFSKVSGNGHSKAIRMTGNVEEPNSTQNLRPDFRFNAILEKLRITTSDLQTHI